MSVQLPRPELACHDEAMRKPFPTIASELREILGAQLVAYIGRVKETRAVRDWAEGKREVGSSATERRLRLAYGIARCIAETDGRQTAQAWFQGLNPLLEDVSPARLLREGDLDVVGPLIMSAERRFLANG